MPPTGKGVQYTGICPFEAWQVDFTQMPETTENFKFLLVFGDTFSGWVEAYSARTEKAIEGAKLLLKEIIPRFGLLIAFEVTMDHYSLQKFPRQ